MRPRPGRWDQSWWLYESIPEQGAPGVSKQSLLWGGNMAGIVLEVRAQRKYVKILTPTGPGWAYRGWVERA
ncbi:MAG: hypothetical protein FJY85_00795 [Deltaproteobacteria bacterium]|nr:hypothetical protein [Deltaproteobacteria bacterium]